MQANRKIVLWAKVAKSLFLSNNIILSMKRNTLFKCLAVLAGCACSAWLSAADIVLKSAGLSVLIADSGYYSSIKVGHEEVLSAEKSPVVLACIKGDIVTPQKAEIKGKTLRLTMSDRRMVTLAYTETPNCVTVEAISVPDVYDVLLFGPVKVNIHEVVGDVIGVVQGRGVAFGVQALHPKVLSGLPEDYLEVIKQAFSYEGKSTELSVGSVADCRQAATEVSDGAVLQFMCRNRSRLEHRKVMAQEGAMVLPVKGPDAQINGAKVAWFGCQASEALDRIGAIEVEQGLPHPMFDGEWGKTARAAMRSYLITDITEDNLDWILDKAERAGFKYVYHPGPFEDWGHLARRRRPTES